MDSTKTSVTKETKKKIRVDYEGKISLKERLVKKFTTSTQFSTEAIFCTRFK